MTGLSKDGSPITAVSQGQPLSGELFACVNCHRHSGLGTSEGGYQVPDITGPTLFSPIEVKQRELYAERTEGFYTRPAYTRESLRTAITHGISTNGNTFSKVMPRYQLSQSQADALIDYLSTLDYSNPPGVSADNLQLATIVTEGTSKEKKLALINTLNQFFKEKNAQTRHEVRRVKYSPWHKDWHYDNYRHWQLNTWELNGDPSTWQAQLQRYYDANPVFAVVGGTSHLGWNPISSFCEAEKLPCLFPDTDLPPSKPGHYSIYFSAGMSLEARRIIHFLKKNLQYDKVIQITGKDPRGAVATEELQKRISKLQNRITFEKLAFSELLNTPTRILENSARNLYVLWLTEAELKHWPTGIDISKSRTILSSTLLDRRFNQIPGRLSQTSWLAHPYSLPGDSGRRIRSKAWIYARKIVTPYDKLQSNTYLALSVLTESMMHIRSNFSQDYLIERIEHMLENSPETSVYQRLSLAPGQRFASKGSYLIPLTEVNVSPKIARQYWAVPEL
ncbi:c-type cytochrome [Amphritea japonica]|nr:c-type cytochrome [Amphritea japonica]